MLAFPTYNLAQVAGRVRDRRTEAHCIVPRLYLTDYPTASNAQELSRLAVTHVVSVLDYDITLPDFIKDENKLHIRVQDLGGVKLLDHFDKTTSFINAALEKNSKNVVLVHCLMGISRSATVVCAYLIATKGMNAPEALECVQSKRSIVCPNLGFRKQLETYAERFESDRKERESRRILSKVKAFRFWAT
ncbi:Protein-tyrosine phosphatase-like protein [Amanita muscaria]